MSEFITFLHEVFERFGAITTRKMFGGYGIYHQGLMIALVEDDTLYLKVDASNKHHFESRGLAAFQYAKEDRMIKMSYYLALEEIYEDPEAASLWAMRSYEAALRSKTSTGKSKKRR